MESQPVAAITAEYNPFHKGHAHQINVIRETLGDVPIIAVMSGAVTQRGELALWDKWERARLALRNGVDLVLEIPAVSVLRSADHFAAGALSVMRHTGLVTHICFGMENPDRAKLTRLAAEIPDIETFEKALKAGTSYAESMALAYTKKDPAYASFFKGSNNLLALSYAKMARTVFPSATLLPILRKGTPYNEEGRLTEKAPSAAALRHFLEKQGPEAIFFAAMGIKDKEEQAHLAALPSPLFHKQRLDLLTAYALESVDTEHLSRRIEVTEGLERALIKARGKGSFDAIAAACSGRRYSRSRIRRLLLQLLCAGEIRAFTGLSDEAPYLRILAFSKRGRELLHLMKKTATRPVFSLVNKDTPRHLDEEARRKLSLDLAATSLWELAATGTVKGGDYKKPPIKD
ncbi:nucleotidyltransferase family protein [uncultured Acidaminococcus sp.]|jgi:predicted nucleotidyltransferase|uniref:nucleotidyltransferase family protein n=1 Tax=uncultured Acidaminococcus sp. TaxID=352152 RepID=UPI0025E01667|nr:nucleotidyltransferase family protein [uncultured Acidaminococcus sp.]